MERITVAVDAMGGDNAPNAIVAGAIEALRRMPEANVLLFGRKEALEGLIADCADVRDRLEIVPCEEVISIEDSPMLAIRKKKDSSLVRAMLAVREKQAQAVLSAGSTGAVLAGGMFRVGRIQGIDRPALAPVIPGREKPYLLIDAGANVDCQSAYLEQFGLMGSVYMEKVLHVKDPLVCLANIGAEEEKGNKLYKEAYQRMKAQTAYRFGGNIEGRDIPFGRADVVVADGFDGNLILKYTEGLAMALMGMLKDEIRSSTRAKLGALLMKDTFAGFKKRMNYEDHGGAPLLGVEGVVVKAHGSSSAKAIASALRQTRDMVIGDVPGQIRQGLLGLSGKEREKDNV
ncbi:MAG: phosphate acyltransferase PlsX [Christensenellales bacterium]|jgi:glycerol-3-phosphate acyltransferase PlsX